MTIARIIAAIAALAALPAVAIAGEFPLEVSEKTLENGLRIFVVKRPGLGEAACALAVRVGSSAEVPGVTGAAHFLEHMMFKGSDRMGVKDAELDKQLRDSIDSISARILSLEDSGASPEALDEALKTRADLFKQQQDNLELNPIFGIYGAAGSTSTNAFTSEDQTVYFSVLPAHKIELFFWVESERFSRPVFRQFHAEKDVVREERRLSENRPGHMYREELSRVLYASHPYAHPVLGYHEDLRRMTRTDLRGFFDTWYTPDNMFLLVAGDVDECEVFRLARKYFGHLRPFDGKRRTIPVLPVTNSGFTRVLGVGPGNPGINVAFRMPPGGSPRELECELIAMKLSDPEGALRRELVEERELATSVHADYDAGRFGGTLWINVELKRGASPLDAEIAVLRATDSLARSFLDDAELAALGRRYRARILGSLRNEMRIGFSLLRRANVGSPSDIERMLARSRTVSPEDIRKLATEHLDRANCVSGIYTQEPLNASLPAPAEPIPARDDEIPQSWKELQFEEKSVEFPSPAPEPEKMGNGARVLYQHDDADPFFRIEVMLRGGSDLDPEGKEGLASLLAATANRSGLEGLSRARLRGLMEDLVADARFEARGDCLALSFSTFRNNGAQGLDLLRKLLFEMELDEAQFLVERGKLEAEVRAADSSPRDQVGFSFDRLLLPGTPRARRPTPESVSSISFDDVRAAIDRALDPASVIFAVSGGFDRDSVAKSMAGIAGGFRTLAGQPHAAKPVKPAAPSAGVHVMDFDASQGYVLAGARAPSRREVKEYAAAWMLQTVLSRRLFDRIRSNEGLSYQAGARISPEWDMPSAFNIMFQTKAKSVAFGVWLAFDEIARITSTPPDAEEMALARRKLAANLRRTLGRADERAGALAALILSSAPADWHERFFAAADAVTAEQVSAAAGSILDPSRMLVVCVGRKAEMLAGDGVHDASLDKFGALLDIEPPATPKAPSTPKDVVLLVVRKLAQGDVDGIAPYLSGSFGKRLEEPGARKMLAGQGRMLGSARYEVSGSKIDAESAEVALSVKMKMGEQEVDLKLVFALLRENGAWAVDGIRMSQ